ncbi:MFS transporter [Longispora sp. K20-0274]|uniref:MFS transporter n=1 Tax=Longispora sp. K20-0274 TaxID=3088255 RepID=UPI00399A2A32
MTITAPDAGLQRVSTRAERLFIPAVFVTNLGNNIQLIAASFLVFKAAGTTLSVGWVYIAVAVPQVLLSWLFGRLADRFDRRTLCIVADVCSALAAVALPVWLLAGGARGPAAYVTSFVLAAIAGLFMPASNALMKERIAPDRLGHFNANYEIAYQAGTLLSGLIGGFAIQYFGTTPIFFFNALTFVTSAVCVYFMGRLPVAPPKTETPVAEVAATPPPKAPILRLGMLFVVGTIIVTVANTLLMVLVIQRFKSGAGLLGIVDAAAGIGILIAATHYKRLKGKVHYVYLILLGYVGVGIGDMLMVVNVPMLVIMIMFAGYAFGIARLSARTELMAAISPAQAGRVFGTANAFGLAGSLAATLAIAVTVDRTSIVTGFIILGLIGIVPTILITSTLFGQRRVTQS